MLIKHPNINPDKSIWENFADGQELYDGRKTSKLRAYLSRFNFGGRTKQESFHAFWWRTQPFAPYNDLKEEGVLLLDEPTNDLDINTSCLRGRFESFAGCAVLFRMTDGFRQNLYTHSSFEGNSGVLF
jgi:ATPase subunit of ABC transporter with duplicated ATPase domains